MPDNRRFTIRFGCAFLPAVLLFAAPAIAEPTPVTVRVISQDAKFVGDSTGGAQVILRDAESGHILAEGITAGGTGNTDQIMQSTGRSPLPAIRRYTLVLFARNTVTGSSGLGRIEVQVP